MWKQLYPSFPENGVVRLESGDFVKVIDIRSPVIGDRVLKFYRNETCVGTWKIMTNNMRTVYPIVELFSGPVKPSPAWLDEQGYDLGGLAYKQSFAPGLCYDYLDSDGTIPDKHLITNPTLEGVWNHHSRFVCWMLVKRPVKVPEPPKGEEWSNPGEVPLDKVGWEDGWRLLLKSERSPNGLPIPSSSLLQVWCTLTSRWKEKCNGDGPVCTYRTKLPIQAATVCPTCNQPLPDSDHNPDGVECLNGWRFITKHEVLKNELKKSVSIILLWDKKKKGWDYRGKQVRFDADTTYIVPK